MIAIGSSLLKIGSQCGSMMNNDHGRNSESIRIMRQHHLIYETRVVAVVMSQDPIASDGGAYKCTASNDLGESNANINLNFAG